jgi:hypothetical protein
MTNPWNLPKISKISGFAEIPPSQSILFDLPGPLYWTHSSEFIAQADRQLELEGELVDLVRQKGISFEKIEVLPDASQQSLLSSRCKSDLWQAYSETGKSGVRYTVLVEYCDHSETILADGVMKEQVIQYFHREMARFLFLQKASDDSLEFINQIGKRIMYKFGIPYRKMGFFFDHIKRMAGSFRSSQTE